jgi:hypothetical protein
MFFKCFRFISNVNFVLRTKDNLYFQNNNNENGGKFSNVVLYVARKREIRKIRTSAPGCSGMWVLRVF